jgi:hypothetical protein
VPRTFTKMEPITFTKYEPVTRYSKSHFAGEHRPIYGREHPYAFRKVKPSYYGSSR